jgi:AraC family transcriptional regulator, transcriptional activator of pobA
MGKALDSRVPAGLALSRGVVPVQSFADALVGPRFGIRSQGMAAGDRRLHRHDYFEILFFVNAAGEQRISLKDFVSRRGSVFFVAPMTPHQLRFGPGDTCFIIYFDLGFLRPDLAGHNGASIDPQLLARVPELAPFVYQQDLDFELLPERAAQLQMLASRMLRERQEVKACSDEVTRACLTLFLCEVAQDHEASIRELMRARPPMGGGERHVLRVIEFIKNHLGEKISLSDAAQYAAVSPNYLANLLKRETGQTFVEMLTARRMDKACEMLSFTNLRVSQVGDTVGYFDVDYFCRRFKQVVGSTPLEYREAHALVRPV